MGTTLHLNFKENPYFKGNDLCPTSKYIMKTSCYGCNISDKFQMPYLKNQDDIGSLEHLLKMEKWLENMLFVIEYAIESIPVSQYRPSVDKFMFEEDLRNVKKSIKIWKFLDSFNVESWITEG